MARKQSNSFPLDLLWTNNTIFGFILGLLAGLSIAFFVALALNNTPIPFSDIAHSDKSNESTFQSVTDPNVPLYGNREMPKAAYKAAQEKAAEKPDKEVLTYLQAGAYRNKEEAENRKAQLALMGLESRLKEIKSGKNPLYRVQLGPFTETDLMTVQKKLQANHIEFTTSQP